MRLKVIHAPKGDLYQLVVKVIFYDWVTVMKDEYAGENIITIIGGTPEERERLTQQGIITEILPSRNGNSP